MLSPLRSFFLENREQCQWHDKERKNQESEQEIIHKSLVVEDHIRGKSELVMPGSVVVSPFVVRMIVAKLRTYCDELVGPPGNSNGMLRIRRREASPTPNLVIKIFVSHREKGTRSNPKHRVVQHSPLRRIAIFDWE